MSDKRVPVNRHLVGVLALCCFALAALIWFVAADSQESQLWLAGFIRVGLVMSAFWIALPSRGREAAWAHVSRGTLIGIVLAMLALLRLPFRVVLPLFIAVAVIGYTLRPRGKKRPVSRTRKTAAKGTTPDTRGAGAVGAADSGTSRTDRL